MAPIRTFLIASVFTLLLTFAAIGFFGGYQFSNGIQLNSTLALDYNAIIVNQTNPGGLFSFGGLQSQQTISANVLQNGTSFIGSLASGASTLTFAAKFIVTIPVLFYAIIGFIAQPLIVLGIPVGYAEAAMTLLLLGIIVISLLSALFIFPIILLNPKGKKRRKT